METAGIAKTSWTPGPWRVEVGTALIWGECTKADDFATDSMGVPVAEAVPTGERLWGRKISSQERAANARLIAAAPEMAELLERVVALAWDTMEQHSLDVGSEVDSVRFEARALLTRLRTEGGA